MTQVKYSYQYEFIKASEKAGIKIGDTQFFDKKKGDELVKAGWCKFNGKFKLAFVEGSGTCLVKA